ncbi:antitoxin VbhA family protein [Pseudomonas panipatensis]|uniref:antitoxin VbhA family protein n=1 Tax=Pseudomonas panipatensis TaxID=428992 RepID=UPI0014812105
MAIDPKRDQHVERALTSARLSGVRPSAKFLELADRYRRGDISLVEMISKMKRHYEYPAD